MNINFTDLWGEFLHWFSASGLRIILILIFVFISFKISKVISRKIFAPFSKVKLEPEIQKRADTLGSLIRYVLTISILAVGVVMILGEFGIDIGPIIAAAGVVGLAVGFGAQHLVQDIISGFFILLEDQIRVGDVVEVAGRSGLVERVNLRMTVLRDISGNVHFIRNGQIDVVTNMTKEYSRYVLNIGVAYRENVDDVIEVIKQIDEAMRSDPEFKDDILEPVEIMGLDEFADSAIIIKARIKTLPVKQWRIGREFNRRLKIKFDELDIEIPFPHRTVYIGRDKKGNSPALRVKTEKPGEN